MLCYLILYMFFYCTNAVIHKVNRTEYQKFPPLYQLDDYELCLSEPDGVYCDIELNLISDAQNDLFVKLKEYSALQNKHYNHLVLSYGVCATTRCRKYINTTIWDARTTLGECFNDSLWENYKLKTKLAEGITCRRSSKNIEIDNLDIVAGIFFITLLLLNVVGSIYEIYRNHDNQTNVYYSLRAFSVTKNLRTLFKTSPSSEAQLSFKAITGLRSFMVMYLVAFHTGFSLFLSLANTYDFEELFNENTSITFSWALLVQGCFVLSCFLLTKKLQELQDKDNFSWSQVLKLMYMRWLRLIPPIAVLFLYICTWYRYLGDGPLWHRAVSTEIQDCKRDWWRHLFGINNYQNTACLVQTWHTAADFQLYLLTMIIWRLIYLSHKKHIASVFVLFLAMLVPALHTYLQDLDAFILVSPKFIQTVYKRDFSIPPVYRWGHTNMPCCVIGIVLSFLVITAQKKKLNVDNYKKYRVLYWCTVPAMCALVILGSYIREETPRPPVLFRSIYAAFIKPLFGLCVAIIVFGSVFKFEDYYRAVLEWRGWEIINKINYSAFIIQMLVIRSIAGSRFYMTHFNAYNLVSETVVLTITVYLVAFIFWILVEAPLQEIIQKYLSVETTRRKENKID